MRFIYTKGFLAFVGCLVAVALLVVLDSLGWLPGVRRALVNAPRPFVAAASWVSEPVHSFFGSAFQLRRIAEDNARLTREAADLKSQIVELDQLRLENEALRKELLFTRQSKLPLVPCRVAGRNPLGLTDTVTLACGTDQGVREGLAIVSEGYLVGKITYAGPSVSTALLITSSKFSIDAKLSKTNATGLAGGSFGTGLVLDRLPQREPLERGMLVVTAGLTDQVPRNLLIGAIGDLLSTQGDLFQKTSLVSPVDFSNIEYTFAVAP